MTIIAAVTDSREGRHALAEAVVEAKHFNTDLVAVNLGRTELDLAGIDTDGVEVTVIDRTGVDKEERVEAVIDEITTHKATRLVIGVKRRSPVGKVILGSLSQQLLLNSPVPVVAVKLPEGEYQSSVYDLPGGLTRVTG